MHLVEVDYGLLCGVQYGGILFRETLGNQLLQCTMSRLIV